MGKTVVYIINAAAWHYSEPVEIHGYLDHRGVCTTGNTVRLVI